MATCLAPYRRRAGGTSTGAACAPASTRRSSCCWSPILFAGAPGALFGTIRQELTPTGRPLAVLLRISAPQGVSLDYTTSQMRKIERTDPAAARFRRDRQHLRERRPERRTNSGFMVMTLAPWDQRERSQQQIVGDRPQAKRRCLACASSPLQPNSLGIRGAGSGLQFALIGNSYTEFGEAALKRCRGDGEG
jgi:HAE1 family hydrophobic/amphiphilic exporter-1